MFGMKDLRRSRLQYEGHAEKRITLPPKRCDACGIESPDVERLEAIPGFMDELPYVCVSYRACCNRWASAGRLR